MPDTQRPEPDELAVKHREAQASALDWARKADREHKLAVVRGMYARENAGHTHMSDEVAKARADAQLHRGNSYEASRLAEMWARVALALAPLQAPANGQPVTYDIQLIGSADAATQLEDTLRRLQERRGPGKPSP